MDWLNYHQLLNFWLVAREGSVRQASELLHVTPASVSAQVRNLERSLGAKLLRKQGRGVAVSEVGELVAAYADDIFAKGQELQEMVRGRPPDRPLELHVGVRDIMPKFIAFRLLQPALELEQARAAGLPGRRHRAARSRLNHPQTRRRLIGHPTRPAVPSPGVLAPPRRIGCGVWATAALARKYRSSLPDSLEKAPVLLLTLDSALRRQLDRWFHDLVFAPRIVGEFAVRALMKIAGNNGLGVLAVSSVVGADVKQAYGLTRAGLAEGVEEQFYAVSVERKITHPAVLAIRQQAS